MRKEPFPFDLKYSESSHEFIQLPDFSTRTLEQLFYEYEGYMEKRTENPDLVYRVFGTEMVEFISVYQILNLYEEEFRRRNLGRFIDDARNAYKRAH